MLVEFWTYVSFTVKCSGINSFVVKNFNLVGTIANVGRRHPWTGWKIVHFYLRTNERETSSLLAVPSTQWVVTPSDYYKYIRSSLKTCCNFSAVNLSHIDLIHCHQCPANVFTWKSHMNYLIQRTTFKARGGYILMPLKIPLKMHFYAI